MFYVDLSLVFLGIIVLLASLISLRFGISVAIVEIVFGVIAGNLNLINIQDWMIFLSTFGGIFLTFLAGAETDVILMKNNLRESLSIGLASFFLPFFTVFILTYFFDGWSYMASLLAGAALSETAVAVVYFVLVENNLLTTAAGKRIMAATFITNLATALALSVLFFKPTLYTLLFYIISVLVIVLATKFSHLIFDNERFQNKVIEPEIKYIFMLLLIFMVFAQLGGTQAILPAFILGLSMSRRLVETTQSIEVKKRMKTVAFAFITPIFFIIGGMKLSLYFILANIPLFVVLLATRQLSKMAGIYIFARRYVEADRTYTTLLLSTGLTFGLIACLFGLSAGYLNQMQYSILTGVLIISTVIPTFIAQKWYNPLHSEDLLDVNID
ncbi:MAG: Sodium/hydrogen exchanger family protein [Methanobacterium sp. PtaB.Bin024]|jgi:Kef-type K+ transport system membrane component KefB|nr:MAG: Sodium/hydrogen exchanger family protein [Methanobacterium sp. PtaB.Bin024]